MLKDLSLTIAAGKVTAIVGSSGAGKSTVADLVNGLLSPGTGRVLIDGAELTPQAARAWRRHVGYVAQDTVLFHDTVRANLRWANPDASEQEMRESLSLAAAEFVFELPQGLDTTVGDRGMLLSHGQRQRIALARALLRRPGLLILDEATSSLDFDNEKRILDAIEQLKGRATVLLIAHRVSAIQRADMIYVIENGSGRGVRRLAEPQQPAFPSRRLALPAAGRPRLRATWDPTNPHAPQSACLLPQDPRYRVDTETTFGLSRIGSMMRHASST